MYRPNNSIDLEFPKTLWFNISRPHKKIVFNCQNINFYLPKKVFLDFKLMSWAGLLCIKSSYLLLEHELSHDDLGKLRWKKHRASAHPVSPLVWGLFAILSAPLKWRAVCPAMTASAGFKSVQAEHLKLQALNVCSQVQHLFFLSDFFFLERHLVGFLLDSSLLHKHRSRILHITYSTNIFMPDLLDDIFFSVVNITSHAHTLSYCNTFIAIMTMTFGKCRLCCLFAE